MRATAHAANTAPAITTSAMTTSDQPADVPGTGERVATTAGQGPSAGFGRPARVDPEERSQASSINAAKTTAVPAGNRRTLRNAMPTAPPRSGPCVAR